MSETGDTPHHHQLASEDPGHVCDRWCYWPAESGAPKQQQLAEVIAHGVAAWDWHPLDWTYLDAETQADCLEKATPIAAAVLRLLAGETIEAVCKAVDEGH